MKRPCIRHEDAQTCALIIKTREKSFDTEPAEAAFGRHKKPWPGEDVEHALPFTCGKHVATGGVR